MPATPLDESSVPSILSAGTVLGFLLGYLFGRIHAVWQRARRDYNAARTAVPGLRKTKWGAWWRMVQRGFVAVVVLIVLIAWAANTAPGR
jgi:SNF family Na+-dependent transporter